MQPAKHPITLRFSDEDLEAQFIQDYIEKSRRPIEVGLIAGLLVYGALFGVMDWIQASNAMTQIWVIRGLVCTLGLATLIYNRKAEYPIYLHEIVAGVILIAGIGLLTMILIDHSTDAYLDGPVLLVLPAYVLFRLRFVHASIVGLVVFILYCIVIYFVEGMRATDLVASAIFLFAANLIGMVAGYALENYARKEFVQTRIIDQERKTNAELLEVKNRFFANISHEIRTPLTLIVGPLEDVLAEHRADLPVGVRRVLSSARSSGERLLKFINQLLDLSRVDAQQMPSSLKRGNLNTFLQSEVTNFHPYAASNSVHLSFTPAALPIEMVTDFDKLEIVASNLISNAIKYTPADGTVRVSVYSDSENQQVKIEVRDTGSGISAHELPYIFDRFYRVNSGTAVEAEGLGLGLSLTKAMIEQLSGEITVESEEGFGSTFTVVLPRIVEGLRPERLEQIEEFAEPESGVGSLEEIESPVFELQNANPAG